MPKLIAQVVLAGLFLFNFEAVSQASNHIEIGKKCSKIGKIASFINEKVVCAKTNKGLRWSKLSAKTKAYKPPAPIFVNLSLDSRITPKSDLSVLETCKTGDLSFNPNANNGFPRPQSIVQKPNIRILALPIIFNEIPFTDNDMVQLNKALIDAAYTYSMISMGRTSIKFEIAKKDHWVKLEKSAAQYGIVPSGPQQNNSIIAKDAIALANSEIDFNLYDGVLIESAYSNLTSVGQGMTGEVFTAKNGTSAKRVSLQLGRVARNASIILHEMGHTLFALEDVFIFLNSSRPSVPDPNPAGPWDIMSHPTNEMFGWNKLLMGWLQDDEVRCTQSQKTSNHFLVNISNPNGPKLVLINLSFGKTIALESRNGPGDEGYQELLVYKVDSSINHGDGPITARKSLISTLGSKTKFDTITIELLAKSTDGVLFSISNSDVAN
jgi:M6 family metalloprotease-like protein